MGLATDLPAAASSSQRSLPIGDDPVNILLVDDQPRNLEALEAILDGLPLNLVRARSGPEALRQLLRMDFAAILMDVYMPGMDGLETASLIRARPRSKHTPVIFLTAYEDTDRLFRGYELGAIDYLIKPIAPTILRGKVNVLVDLFQTNRKVQRQAEQLREMERQRHENELIAARERWETQRLRAEAQEARLVQERFFPVERVPLPGFDISGSSFPAEATGGDHFDYVPMLDNSVGVVIGDVSGHGFGPALLQAAIRSYLRALALTHIDIGTIFGLLNRALCMDVPEGRFATLFLGRLDAQRRLFTYASAGHPSGYLLDSQGRVKRSLGSTGMPLGILPDETYESAEPVALAEGDLLVLVTDGMLEAPHDDGTQFGSARLLELVRANRLAPARVIVDALYRTVREQVPGAQQDDMTAIVIKVESVPARIANTDSMQSLVETLVDIPV
jgi:serine phosphatase RsbU (regulator of sigma subunit)